MIKAAEKYLLAFPKEQLKEISRIVSRAGCFEVLLNWSKDNALIKNSLKKKIADNLQTVEYRLASLDFAINYLIPWTKKESFLKKLKQPKIIVDKKIKAALGLKERQFLFQGVKRLEEIEKQLNGFQREEREIAGRLKDLECFGDLDFIPRPTQYSISLLVFCPQATIEGLKEAAKEHFWHLRELSVSASKLFFVLVGSLADKEEIQNVLKGLKIEIMQCNFRQSPLAERQALLNRREAIDKEKSGLQKEILGLAGDSSKLKIYRDLLAIKKTKLEVRQRVWQDGFLAYLVFWAYEGDLKKLKCKLKGLKEKIILSPLTLEEGEEPPVILQNNKLIAPFQAVTEIFGMPRHNELDPTPYLAFFFILFFGICLTDAGYGLLMMVITVLALVFLKKVIKDSKLVVLMFYGGISTVIMGILFGGYFGASVTTLEKVPWLLKLKQLDPIEDTVLFMLISFGLGYLQVFFAQIVKIISAVKSRNTGSAFSGISWALFYIALVVAGLNFWKNFGNLFAYSFLGFSTALLFTSESAGVKVILKPLVGLVKIAQGLIGTMSDVLSYSRLVALGLATGVIALIVNKIAFLLGDMVPYVGFLVTALIMAGGHIFNLGINALGAFIHSGRLQFVEFFPKFLEGGGRRFKPVQPELKYIEIH